MTPIRFRGRLPLGAAAVAIGAAVAAAVWIAREAGWLQEAELAAYDQFAFRRALRAELEPPNVALVRIREEEIARYGHPLPDAVLARALERIEAAGARAIGLDLYRAARAAGTDPAGWRERWPAPGPIRASSSSRSARSRACPASRRRSSRRPDQVGFSDLPIDPDGVLRRGLLFLWDADGRPSLSLSLQLALRYLAGGRNRARRPIPSARSRCASAPLRCRPSSPTTAATSARTRAATSSCSTGGARRAASRRSRVGGGAGGQRRPPTRCAGRVVIVGTSAPSVKDEFRTAQQRRRGRSTGIEVHAHAVDQLLRLARGAAAPTRVASAGGEAAWILAWSLAAALLARWMRAPAALAGALGARCVAGAPRLELRALSRGPLAARRCRRPLAALGSAGLVLAEAMRRERAERAVVMDLFGRFVSRGVARELWERRAEFMDGGRPRSQRLVVTARALRPEGLHRARRRRWIRPS